MPYHRLVAELFHVAGASEQLAGGQVPQAYKDRLLAMAQYTEAYTRPDGLHLAGEMETMPVYSRWMGCLSKITVTYLR